MSTTRSSARPLAFGFSLALATFGSSFLPAHAAEEKAGETKPAAAVAGQVVAEVAGEPITEPQLEDMASAQLRQLDRQRHQVLEQTLNQLVEQKLSELEAAKRGITREQLLNEEVQGKVGEISAAQIDEFYEQNKGRIKQPKEQIAAQIQQYLQQQKASQLQNEFIKGLKEKYKVKLLFEPLRSDVQVAGAPAVGPENAPVTLVLFSDFQCPFCSRVEPTLDQVKQTYGDKVRVAFRQFPLSIHPNAKKAAEASLCANEQGKFWQMHDAMFKDQQNLSVEGLKAKAVQLELNADQFNSCLDSGKYAAKVQEDVASGEQAGVSGTPALFINGRFISGAVPYEQIASIIDDELARKAVQTSAN